MSDARQEAREAFDRWASAAISEVLLEELRQAAIESETSLWKYVGEVLEAHVATRRLPKVQAAPMGARTRAEFLDEPEALAKDQDFPFPAATYQTSGLPRRHS